MVDVFLGAITYRAYLAPTSLQLRRISANAEDYRLTLVGNIQGTATAQVTCNHAPSTLFFNSFELSYTRRADFSDFAAKLILHGELNINNAQKLHIIAEHASGSPLRVYCAPDNKFDTSITLENLSNNFSCFNTIFMAQLDKYMAKNKTGQCAIEQLEFKTKLGNIMKFKQLLFSFPRSFNFPTMQFVLRNLQIRYERFSVDDKRTELVGTINNDVFKNLTIHVAKRIPTKPSVLFVAKQSNTAIVNSIRQFVQTWTFSQVVLPVMPEILERVTWQLSDLQLDFAEWTPPSCLCQHAELTARLAMVAPCLRMDKCTMTCHEQTLTFDNAEFCLLLQGKSFKLDVPLVGDHATVRPYPVQLHYNKLSELLFEAGLANDETMANEHATVESLLFSSTEIKLKGKTASSWFTLCLFPNVEFSTPAAMICTLQDARLRLFHSCDRYKDVHFEFL